MNFIETLLSESLKKKHNQLDLEKADRQVLKIACKDMMNYLKVQWGLTGEKAARYKLVNKLEEYFHNELEELQEFIRVWSGLWLKKWGERVKLLIGKRKDARWKRMHKLLRSSQSLWNELQDKKEIKDIIIETLVKNGEICGTSILSENLLKFELGSYAKKKVDVTEPEVLLNLVNDTLRRARNVSRSRGALIFLRISKSFFNS